MITDLVKPGEVIPDFLHNHHVLPIGSTVNRSNSYTYEVEAPGVLTMQRGGSSMGDPFDPYHFVYAFKLKALPEGESITLPPMDIDSWLWRIRDAALAAAERSSVNQRPVLDLLGRLGADRPRFGLGQPICNSHDIGFLPDGATLYAGHPSKPKRLTVFRKYNGGLHTVLGSGGRAIGAPLVLYEADGVDELPTPTQADPKALATAAVRAWRIGKQFKQEQGWCDVFEYTLTALGIDDKTVEQAGEIMTTVGETVSPEQCARLPLGSLLAHNFDRGGIAIYQRVEGKRNQAQTQRVWGCDDNLRNSNPVMQVIWMPGQQLRYQIAGRYVRALPDGVTVSNGFSQTYTTPITDTSFPDWRMHTITAWPELVPA